MTYQCIWSVWFPGPNSHMPEQLPIKVIPDYDHRWPERNHPMIKRAWKGPSGNRHTGKATIRYTTPVQWAAEGINELQYALDWLGQYIPVRESPGKTGMDTIKEIWFRRAEKEHVPPWEHRPKNGSNKILDRCIVGGRIQDPWRDDRRNRRMYERPRDSDICLDEPGSYLQHLRNLPSGYSYVEWSEDHAENVALSFGTYEIREPDLPLPFLPQLGKITKTYKRWLYKSSNKPRIVGLWNEELLVAHSLGYETKLVSVDGYAPFVYWKKTTDVFADWCSFMQFLRKEAGNDPSYTNVVKRVYSAAVCCFRQYGTRSYYDDPIIGEHVLHTPNPLGNSYDLITPPSKQNMIHWYSYLLSQVRLSLWKGIYPYIGNGLVGMATDSFYVREVICDPPSTYKVKGTRREVSHRNEVNQETRRNRA